MRRQALRQTGSRVVRDLHPNETPLGPGWTDTGGESDPIDYTL